jgi:hypothetical protein
MKKFLESESTSLSIFIYPAGLFVVIFTISHTLNPKLSSLLTFLEIFTAGIPL